MLALAALAPIALAIALMALRNWPARHALPLAWAGTLLVALAVFRVAPVHALAYSGLGVLKAADFLAVIAAAVLLINLLRSAGAWDRIAESFDHLSPDPRIQAILVGWLFGALIEGVAGFGTPAALGAPLLVSLGFPPLAAASICLVYNCTPVAFAAGGLPVEATLEILAPLTGHDPAFAHDVTVRTALFHAIAGTFLPLAGLLLLSWQTHRRLAPGWAAAPFALFAGLAMTLPYLASAVFLGREFPALLGPLVGLALCAPVARLGWLTPRTPWVWPGTHPKEAPPALATLPPLWKSWLPILLVVAVLLATRLPQLGLRPWLDLGTLETSALFGIEGLRYRGAWLMNPGLLPFLPVALLALVWFRLDATQRRAAFALTAKQLWGAAIAIVAAVAMVMILVHSGDHAPASMVGALAEGAARLAGPVYPIASPFLGLLGGVVSGSNTMSNILFATVQYQTAELLGLSAATIVAAQIASGSAGSMLNFHSTLSVSLTVGLPGQEGALMRRNLPASLGYVAVLALLTLLAVRLG